MKPPEWANDTLYRVSLILCGHCLNGEGGECHTAGCGFWLNRAPDLPLTKKDNWPILNAQEL